MSRAGVWHAQRLRIARDSTAMSVGACDGALCRRCGYGPTLSADYDGSVCHTTENGALVLDLTMPPSSCDVLCCDVLSAVMCSLPCSSLSMSCVCVVSVALIICISVENYSCFLCKDTHRSDVGNNILFQI